MALMKKLAVFLAFLMLSVVFALPMNTINKNDPNGSTNIQAKDHTTTSSNSENLPIQRRGAKSDESSISKIKNRASKSINYLAAKFISPEYKDIIAYCQVSYQDPWHNFSYFPLIISRIFSILVPILLIIYWGVFDVGHKLCWQRNPSSSLVTRPLWTILIRVLLLIFDGLYYKLI